MSARLIYDVSIWEEIRSIVCWKTGELVKNINREISKDTSLVEFQDKQPIPWQLREIMEQRANAWVQRVYDLCCDAYKNRGKAVSADFDRAVWAYCVEPFIMGQKEADIHHETMSGFLELLLCAVGSPRERRRFLTVSQKDCCLDVRRKVFEAWYDRLHRLPPRIDEAAAALARFNAMERRAVRIAAGLPPGPLPAPRTAPASAQPDVSGPTQIPPVPASGTVSALPPLDPVQKGAATELPPDTKGDVQTLSNGAGAATWGAVEIVFLSDKRVQIRNGTNSETLNYAEFGFEDGRTGNPNHAWETLCALAEQGGTIQDASKIGGSWRKVEKRIQEIRKVLREHFLISADPIPFISGVGYKACFKIRCGPSFHA